MHTIPIVVFNQVQSLTFIGINNIFSLANNILLDLPENLNGEALVFNTIICSEAGQAVVDDQGSEIIVDCTIEFIAHCDAIILPGSISANRNPFLQDPLSTSTLNWLKDQNTKGALLCGLNSSLFTLGDMGLLNGVECSICPKIYDNFIRRYPLVKTNYSDTVIIDKKILTTRSLISWMEISMKLIRYLAGDDTYYYLLQVILGECSPEYGNSNTIEKEILSQKEGDFNRLNTGKNRFLASIDHIILQSPYQSISVKELASKLAISERTLSRKIKKLTGKTTKELIDDIRIEYSKTLLKNTDKQINQISLLLGYTNSAVFRRIFQRKTGLSPTKYRKN